MEREGRQGRTLHAQRRQSRTGCVDQAALQWSLLPICLMSNLFNTIKQRDQAVGTNKQTNKQASKQANKQTNKQTNKQKHSGMTMQVTAGSLAASSFYG